MSTVHAFLSYDGNTFSTLELSIKKDSTCSLVAAVKFSIETMHIKFCQFKCYFTKVFH